MEHFIEFAEITGAILASMGLAMGMEWCCLRWLMRLMPGVGRGAVAESAHEIASEVPGASDESLAEESAKAA